MDFTAVYKIIIITLTFFFVNFSTSHGRGTNSL